MPAIGMGGSPANYGNPSDNKFVLMSPLSGPKGSPKDAQQCSPARTVTNGVMDKVADPTNYSTGALNTGIGYGSTQILDTPFWNKIDQAGFYINCIPGHTRTNPETSGGASLWVGSIMYLIGGGRSVMAVGNGSGGNGTPSNERVSRPVPYGGQGLGGFGSGNIGVTIGSSRDAGPGPAFTCFNTEMLSTTVDNVADGDIVSGTFVNRSGKTIAEAVSAVFSSNTVATPAP